MPGKQCEYFHYYGDAEDRTLQSPTFDGTNLVSFKKARGNGDYPHSGWCDIGMWSNITRRMANKHCLNGGPTGCPKIGKPPDLSEELTITDFEGGPDALLDQIMMDPEKREELMKVLESSEF